MEVELGHQCFRFGGPFIGVFDAPDFIQGFLVGGTGIGDLSIAGNTGAIQFLDQSRAHARQFRQVIAFACAGLFRALIGRRLGLGGCCSLFAGGRLCCRFG